MIYTPEDLPKPITQLTNQEIKALLALTSDAIMFSARELRDLQARYDMLSDELTMRGE
jgi:hypothetical protein